MLDGSDVTSPHNQEKKAILSILNGWSLRELESIAIQVCGKIWARSDAIFSFFYLFSS